MRGWVGHVCNFPSQEVRGWSQISGGGTPADNQPNQFHLCHRRNHIDQMEILRVAKSLIPMLFLLVFLASAIPSASKIYGLSLKKKDRERERERRLKKNPSSLFDSDRRRPLSNVHSTRSDCSMDLCTPILSLNKKREKE